MESINISVDLFQFVNCVTSSARASSSRLLIPPLFGKFKDARRYDKGRNRDIRLLDKKTVVARRIQTYVQQLSESFKKIN